MLTGVFALFSLSFPRKHMCVFTLVHSHTHTQTDAHTYILSQSKAHIFMNSLSGFCDSSLAHFHLAGHWLGSLRMCSRHGNREGLVLCLGNECPRPGSGKDGWPVILPSRCCFGRG